MLELVTEAVLVSCSRTEATQRKLTPSAECSQWRYQTRKVPQVWPGQRSVCKLWGVSHSGVRRAKRLVFIWGGVQRGCAPFSLSRFQKSAAKKKCGQNQPTEVSLGTVSCCFVWKKWKVQKVLDLWWPLSLSAWLIKWLHAWKLHKIMNPSQVYICRVFF